MNDDPEIEFSPLCQELDRDGHVVDIQIYRIPGSGWSLEVVDELNNSTVWDDLFETDAAALYECLSSIDREGIESVSGPIQQRPAGR